MALHILSSILFLSLSYAADHKLTCEEGQMRALNEGKTTVWKSSYCYDASKTILYSKNCAKKSCVAFSFKEPLRPADFMGAVGNPGFAVCRKLGGEAEIIEFLAQGKWSRLDRCKFKDGSFVSTDTLAGYYFKLKPVEDDGFQK